MNDFLDQFLPANINSDATIDFLDNKKLSEKDIAFSYISPNIYMCSVFEKNQKNYLIFKGNGGYFPYSIEILKKIIYHLQKTVKNITNKDLINSQKQQREKQQFNDFKKQAPFFSKTKGWIYILKAITHPYYKIGKTIDIDQRLNQINPALPFKTKLIHTISSDDIYNDELFLHDKFKNKRTNGEWFDLSREDIRLLKEKGI